MTRFTPKLGHDPAYMKDPDPRSNPIPFVMTNADKSEAAVVACHLEAYRRRQNERDATAIVEAVNFLRQHGETILSALADQRRLREAAIYYETNFRSCMERLDAIAEQIDEADEEGRGFVPSHILATILAGPETRPEHPDYAALPLPEKAEVES